MREERKTMETLKKEVLFAYLFLQEPGLLPNERKEWEKKYEESRSELEKRIPVELNRHIKKDLSL